MPMKLYDTQDLVPEALRATAIETKDGKWAVEEPADPALSDAGKRALEAEREKTRIAEKARKDAEKKAADLEREKEARAKGISEEELQKIRDAEALARKPIEEERDLLAAENKKLKLTDRVRALYLDPKVGGGMADRVEDAMDQLEKRTRLGDKGGIVFLDKDRADTTDDAETFFKKFKAEKPWLFKGAGGSGGGSEGSNGGGDVPLASEATKEAKRREIAGSF